MHSRQLVFRCSHNDLPYQYRLRFDNQLSEVDLTKNTTGKYDPPWHADIPRLLAGHVGAQVCGRGRCGLWVWQVWVWQVWHGRCGLWAWQVWVVGVGMACVGVAGVDMVHVMIVCACGCGNWHYVGGYVVWGVIVMLIDQDRIYSVFQVACHEGRLK